MSALTKSFKKEQFKTQKEPRQLPQPCKKDDIIETNHARLNP